MQLCIVSFPACTRSLFIILPTCSEYQAGAGFNRTTIARLTLLYIRRFRKNHGVFVKPMSNRFKKEPTPGISYRRNRQTNRLLMRSMGPQMTLLSSALSIRYDNGIYFAEILMRNLSSAIKLCMKEDNYAP